MQKVNRTIEAHSSIALGSTSPQKGHGQQLGGCLGLVQGPCQRRRCRRGGDRRSGAPERVDKPRHPRRGPPPRVRGARVTYARAVGLSEGRPHVDLVGDGCVCGDRRVLSATDPQGRHRRLRGRGRPVAGRRKGRRGRAADHPPRLRGAPAAVAERRPGRVRRGVRGRHRGLRDAHRRGKARSPDRVREQRGPRRVDGRCARDRRDGRDLRSAERAAGDRRSEDQARRARAPRPGRRRDLRRRGRAVLHAAAVPGVAHQALPGAARRRTSGGTRPGRRPRPT